MEAMTSMRDAAIRPSPMPVAAPLNSTHIHSLFARNNEVYAMYDEWLRIKITDLGAWPTASQAFQRNYCATHYGRNPEQHHGHWATIFPVVVMAAQSEGLLASSASSHGRCGDRLA